MRILITAFEGEFNSSKILLDNIKLTCSDKLYLVNDFNTCKKQLLAKLSIETYDYILAFGQKPVIKNKVYIETIGRRKDEKIESDFDYLRLQEYLIHAGYSVKISDNAGNYLCNHILYHGLRYIREKQIETNMVFLHIPVVKNISDIDDMSQVMESFIRESSINIGRY